jgi:hypothetical protein
MDPLPFVLAAAAAVLSWALCKEEVFREVRERCEAGYRDAGRPLLVRKLCYLPTCEYCTSFWVALAWVLVAGRPVGWDDFRGYALAHQLVWALAVAYMSVFQLVRVHVREGSALADSLREEPDVRQHAVAGAAAALPAARRADSGVGVRRGSRHDG